MESNEVATRVGSFGSAGESDESEQSMSGDEVSHCRETGPVSR
jgi:hypothetical protein